MAQEFTVDDRVYRTRTKLNARQQFHIARRLAPLIGQMMSLGPVLQAAFSDGNDTVSAESIEALLMPFAGALSRMSDEECDYVLDRALAVVQRREGNGAQPVWVDIWNARANTLQFQDIELPAMLRIAAEVLQENLSGFLPTGRLVETAQVTEQMPPQAWTSSG